MKKQVCNIKDVNFNLNKCNFPFTDENNKTSLINSVKNYTNIKLKSVKDKSKLKNNSYHKNNH
jgi:hypothetical protein